MNSGTSGVYMLKNKINGMVYVGSSCDVPMRLGTHFTRDYKLYPDKPLYKDIVKYGESGFEVVLLCECGKEDLLEKEQLYYDLLKPQYNFIRPRKCNFTHPEVRAKAIKNGTTKEIIERRKRLYNTPKYKTLFRELHIEKMKPVEMIKDGLVVKKFISMQEASRYISENYSYVGKNKTSKIKDVCDGNRRTAYGFVWRYSKV